jgi:hypothetical protein
MINTSVGMSDKVVADPALSTDVAAIIDIVGYWAGFSYWHTCDNLHFSHSQ